MPMYEYYCDRCDREVTLTLSISEHQKGPDPVPQVRRQIPAATAQYLRLSNIAEILNPRR